MREPDTHGTARSDDAHAGAVDRGQQLIDRVLDLARRRLGLDVAYLTEMTGDGQVVRLLSGDAEAVGFDAGTTSDNDDTFCMRMLAGELPSVVPDTAAHPRASEVGLARSGLVGAYVGVPVRLEGGRLYGTLCCASRDRQAAMGAEVQQLMAAFSELIAAEIEEDEQLLTRSTAMRDRVDAVLRRGPDILVQPIVELATGRTVGVEALSRFPYASPELVFAEAARVGKGLDLELAAVRAALEVRGGLPEGAYLAINVSPALITSGRLEDALSTEQEPAGLVVEVTEHAPVEDYATLHAALSPIRARGVRLAVDDAGAGFASFRHIVSLEPDIIKLDRSLTAGVGSVRIQDAVVASFVAFADPLGMPLVAEGVETRDGMAALRDLGVGAAQGYYFSRPVAGPLAATSFDVG
jgi:EAL domain-containing protein (putative c-di-GMP-specific phosphodiesterase class I)